MSKRCYSCGSYYAVYDEETIKRYITTIKEIQKSKYMTNKALCKDLQISSTTWSYISKMETFRGANTRVRQKTIKAMESFIESCRNIL